MAGRLFLSLFAKTGTAHYRITNTFVGVKCTDAEAVKDSGVIRGNNIGDGAGYFSEDVEIIRDELLGGSVGSDESHF